MRVKLVQVSPQRSGDLLEIGVFDRRVKRFILIGQLDQRLLEERAAGEIGNTRIAKLPGMLFGPGE